MGKVTVFNSLTLDGVMQAPGRPDEDTRGGFAHGGWAVPYSDEVMGRVAAEGMAGSGSLLLGRRTYQDFHSFWPNQTDNPFTEVLDNTREVRRVHDAAGAARMAQLHPAGGRRRRRRGRAQGAAGPGPDWCWAAASWSSRWCGATSSTSTSS